MIWYPPILTYHRVHPAPTSETPSMTPAVFERQVALLARHWRPLSLAALVGRLEGGGPLPPRAVVLTFDDGTEDTYTYAYPILTRYRVPATVLMISDHVDRPGSLAQHQLRQMAADGITIGSHTAHHAYLPDLPMAQVHEELERSKRDLEASLQQPVEFLSYPGGGFTPAVAQAAREAGYRAACTTNRGFRRWPVDRWALRRITMHASATSRLGLWLRCGGYATALKRLRAPS